MAFPTSLDDKIITKARLTLDAFKDSPSVIFIEPIVKRKKRDDKPQNALKASKIIILPSLR